jgi:hypothetical protein
MTVLGPRPDRSFETMFNDVFESSGDHLVFCFIDNSQCFPERVTCLERNLSPFFEYGTIRTTIIGFGNN